MEKSKNDMAIDRGQAKYRQEINELERQLKNKDKAAEHLNALVGFSNKFFR